MCCYRSRLVFSCCMYAQTLTFHKVVQRHTRGVVGSLVIIFLYKFSPDSNSKISLNIDEVKTYKNGAKFLGRPIYITCKPYCLRLRNDLYCVEWGVKLYSLTHLKTDISNFVSRLHKSIYTLPTSYQYIQSGPKR